MKEKVWQFLFSLEEHPVYASIKKGSMLTFLIFLIGALARLISNAPIAGIDLAIASWHGGFWETLLTAIYNATEGRMALYLVISISYYYAQAKGIRNPLLLLMAVMTSVVDFVLAVGELSGQAFGDYFGVQGALLAVGVAIVCTQFFVLLSRRLMKESQISQLGADDNLKISWVSVVPMMGTLILGGLFFISLTHLLSYQSSYSQGVLSLSALFSQPDQALGNGLIYTALSNFMWVLGIRGGVVLDPLAFQYFSSDFMGSGAIVTKDFLDVFARIGGSGCGLCLVLALFLNRRKNPEGGKHHWSHALVLVNLSELLIFSLPILWNPILLLPFVLVPLLSVVIAYAATVVGLLPLVTQGVSWAVPVGFSGFLATGSLWGVVVQVVILLCGTAVYLPFVRAYQAFLMEKEERVLQKLIQEFKDHEQLAKCNIPLLERSDMAGQVAKRVVRQLRQDIHGHQVDVFYQPQLDTQDRVIGGEALLRWRYQNQMLYPPFVIALAKEAGVLNALALETLHTVSRAIRDINQTTSERLHLSINLVADQLNDTQFVHQVIAILQQYQVEEQIYLELTEETSLAGMDNIDDNIALLGQHGVALAIDDFGMGQTSLSYLKENHFRYVKLDGQMVKHMMSQPRSGEIIASIVSLGENLHYQVIAEYVENRAIKDRLMELGCYIYQGYYYSPAIPKEAFIAYYQKTNAA